jgi:prepilin-type processing-associated H-X9-DG protein
LFPVFAQAREKARQATCLSNVRQIGIAMGMYSQDLDELYPPSQQLLPCPWPEICGTSGVTLTYLYLVQPYSKSNLYSRCPNASDPGTGALGLRVAREGRIGYGMAYPVPAEATAPASGKNFNAIATIQNPASHALVVEGIPDGPSSQTFYNGSEKAYQPHTTTPFAPSEYPVGNMQAFHQRPEGRHQGFVSVVFCDGHAKAMRFENVYPMREEVCKAGNGQSCSSTAITKAANPKLWELWGL